MLEIKNISTNTDIADVDTTGRTVIKYVSAFNSMDSHRDIIRKGAYTKTIKENIKRVKFCWNHQHDDMPVGRVISLEEDNYGLKATSKLSKTQRGNDLLELYNDGVINEHSVGIFTINKKNDDSGNRIITECKLLEYSAVVWGSNENTPLLSVKSENYLDQLSQLNKRSTLLYKKLTTGNLSNETCESLAVEHAVITSKMDEIIKTLSEKKEPEKAIIETTPEIVPEPIDIKNLLDAFKKSAKI